MIDLGRKHDLEAFMAIVNNEQEHPLRRRNAYRVMQSVRKKMRDQKILKLRLRLIAATLANDLVQIMKISERLQDYEHKHYPRRSY